MFRRRQVNTSISAHTLSIKGRSSIRLMAVLMLLSGVIAGLAQPASARTEPERIDGNTYTGIDFGWSLTWDEDVWTDPSEVHSDGSEYVVVATTGDLFASARVDATDWFGGDVDDCVSGWEDILRGGGAMRHIKPIEPEAGIDLPDDAAEGAYSLDLKVGDQLVDFVIYVQCRPLGDDANFVLSLGVMPDYYEDALPLFADLVDGLTIDDDAATTTGDQHRETGDRPGRDDDSSRDDDDSENAPEGDVPGGSGIDGDTYTGVNYPWTVTWNDRYWAPIPDMERNNGGVDAFSLATVQPGPAPVIVAMFETTAEFDGDIDACTAAGRDWLEEGGEAMTDIADADADLELPDVPSDGDVAAFVYTYVEEGDVPVDFYAVQVCLPLDSFGAFLVVHAMIPTDRYGGALPFFNDLIEDISIDFS